MPERLTGVNRVAVSPSVAFSSQVSGFAEVRDNALDCALSDPNANGHFTSPNGMVLMDANQHMGMVGQERPRCALLFWSVRFFSHGFVGGLEKS